MASSSALSTGCRYRSSTGITSSGAIGCRSSLLSAFLALAYMRIADLATDDRVRLLAYLGALLYGLGFVFYLFLGGSDFLFCLRTLRQSKRS
jgi:hypothetical protein